MKKLLFSILTAVAIITPAYAQTTVPQGGTGLNAAATGTVLMGNTTQRLIAVSTSTFSSLLDLVKQIRANVSGVAPITYNSATGAFGCTTASSGVTGCISGTDWDTFNGKLSPFVDLSTHNVVATGTLAVTGKSTLGVASTTQISASTGATFANLYAPNAFFTDATSTDFNLSGWFRDSVNATGTNGQVLSSTGTSTRWIAAGAGTVTAVSVASANGFAGSSSGGATPALTLSTTVTGLLYGNGTSIAATTTTGSGSVVLDHSPTLITPILGVASSTQISASTGATFAALNVPGTSLFTGLITAGLASTTQISASTGATLAALNVPGTSNFTGLLTAANASTTNISASTGATVAALNVTGTSLHTGLATFGLASTTQISASTGATFAALNIPGASLFTGLLTASNASTTNISASTGATFANLYAPNVFFTHATSTNLNLSGWFRDSVNATGTSGQVLQSTGTSTLWQTLSSSGITNAYGSSTFAVISALLDFSTHNLTATGTLNVTGLSTLGLASTTQFSASTGATLANLNIPGASLFTGLITAGLASTTQITASTGATLANLNIPGTSLFTGLLTAGNASTTNISASTGIFGGALNITGNAFLQGNASSSKMSIWGLTMGNAIATGTLDVVGKTTLANASTTQISASTGAWLANAYVSTLFNVAGTSTLATTTATALYIGTTTPSYYPSVGAGTMMETLKVVSGTTTTGGSFWGNVNDFYQHVVTNLGQGVNTESGYTAQNASSTSSTFFGWFGINGPQFATSTTYSTGRANDVTFMGMANDLYITNATVGKNMYFQTGGTGTSTSSTTRMTLTNFGYLGIGTSTPTTSLVNATGSIQSVQKNITGTTTTLTLDWATSNSTYINLSTAAVAIVFKNATTTPGATYSVTVTCPPTGTAGVITWAHVYWVNRTAPTQTTTANCLDMYFFRATYGTSSTPLTPGVIVAGNQSPNF